MARWIITGGFLAVRRDVEGAETLRQVEVDLRRAALPVAADRVAQHIFELRPVEGALARVQLGLESRGALLDLRTLHNASALSHTSSAPTRFSGRSENLTARR
jgi:hypothetical protein